MIDLEELSLWDGAECCAVLVWRRRSKWMEQKMIKTCTGTIKWTTMQLSVPYQQQSTFVESRLIFTGHIPGTRDGRWHW